MVENKNKHLYLMSEQGLIKLIDIVDLETILINILLSNILFN